MFVIGKKYPRKELLDHVDSKQGQTGIIWGPDSKESIIVTSGGRHSKLAGYHDEKLPDGSWIYFGQGKSGDQDPTRFANALLVSGESSVHFFTTKEPSSEERRRNNSWAKQYRYEGLFNVASWSFFVPQEGTRNGDKILKFHLVPEGSGIADYSMPVEEHEGESLLSLREQLCGYITPQAKKDISVKEYYLRSQKARAYALKRAGGTCELCKKPSPFETDKGFPFLEVHHLKRVADGGPDHPNNLSALCPNCHRAIHHSRDRKNLQQKLSDEIVAAEELIDHSN